LFKLEMMIFQGFVEKQFRVFCALILFCKSEQSE